MVARRLQFLSLSERARFAIVAALVGSALGAGCNCSGSVDVPSSAVRISFFFPEDGQVLSSQDDLNADAAGIQIAAVVTSFGLRNGDRVILTNNVDVDGNGDRIPVQGTVNGNQVIFPGYTVPEGTVTLRAAVENVADDIDCASDDRCEEVTVQVVESLCFFNSPVNDEVLTNDQYPDPDPDAITDPFETDVVVDCAGVEDSDTIALTVNGGRPIVAQTTQTSGAVGTLRRVTFPRVVLGEGANVLSVVPKTDANGENGTGATQSISVSVDTGACLANLFPVDGSRLVASNDSDLDSSNGMQAILDVVTDCAGTSAVEIYVRGPEDANYALVSTPAAEILTDPAGSRFRFDGVQLPESQAPFDVSVVALVAEPNDGLRGATAPAAYWVDSVQPVLASATPSDGVCFGPSSDVDDTIEGIQINAFGATTGAGVGSEVWARVYSDSAPAPSCAVDSDCAALPGALCREAACRFVGGVGDSGFTIDSITLPDGAVTLEYVALDLAGNKSAPLEVGLSVIEATPTVTIDSPADGALLGAAADLDLMAANLQIDVALTVSDPAIAASGLLAINGQSSVPFDPATASGTSLTVPLTLLDGNRTLTPRIVDACGETTTGDPVSVLVDATPRTLEVTGYADLANGVEIDDGTLTGALTVDLDIVLGTGFQDRTLTVELFDGVDTSSGRSCVGNSTSVSSATVPAADIGLLVSSIALLDGINCFAVSADDGINPVSTTYLVTRVGSAPAVAFVAPMDGATLDTDSNGALPGFNSTVSLALTAAHVLDGIATVSIVTPSGTLSVYQTPIAAGTTTATFTDLALPLGSFDLVAVFTDSAGNVSASDSVSVTVDTGGNEPQVVIASPANDSALQTSAGNLDFTLNFLGGDATNLVCDLLLDGVSAGLSGAWTDTGVPLSLTTAITGTQTVQAQCTADAGDGFSQLITVTADDTPPAMPSFANEALDTPGRLVFDVTPSYVNTATVDTSATAGLQHNLRVLAPTAGDATTGWIAELTVTRPDASSSIRTRAVPQGDPAVVDFSSVDFGAQDGDITFSVTITDAAGNVSPATAATLTIDRTPPTLTQTAPDPTKTLFTRDDDEVSSLARVDLTFSYSSSEADGLDVALNIVPDPDTLESSGTTRNASLTTGTVNFGTVGFLDGVFAVQAQIFDTAGNEAVETSEFEVRSLRPNARFTIPGAPGVLSSTTDTRPSVAGLQIDARVDSVGVEPGATARLCSTLDVTGGNGIPCEFGFASGFDPGGANELTEAVDGEPTLRGFVVASGATAGGLQGAVFVGSNTTLSEGEQWLHWEVIEADGDPRVASVFRRFVVDSVGPSVTGAVLTQNALDNDFDSTVNLAGTEGTVAASRLTTGVQIDVTGAPEGAIVEVLSDFGGLSAVGSGTLNSGTATFDVSLDQGVQTLSVRVSDENGNQNRPSGDTAFLGSIRVDFEAPTVNLFAPASPLFTSAQAASIDLGGAGIADDRMTLDSSVALAAGLSDNAGLAGGTLLLEAFSDSTLASPIAGSTATFDLILGQSSLTATDFPFAEGSNFVCATLTDSVGNSATSVVREFVTDFRGPEIALEFRVGATPQTCDSFANACTTVNATPPGADTRTWLDTASNDLFFSVAECESFSPPVEACPVSFRLESRVVDATNQGGAGDGRPFSQVTGGGISSGDTTLTSFSTAATGELFDPGSVREVRLVGSDSNGNASVSNSVFLALGIKGVIIVAERLDDVGAPTGVLLESDAFYGIDDNLDATGTTFQTDLRVTVTAVGEELPDSLVLTAANVDGSNSGAMQANAVGVGTGSYQVDVLGVQLATSAGGVDKANAIDIDVDCTADPDCGARTYSNIIADIDAPTYQFDRCSLCAYEVPFAGDEVALCGACSTLDAEVAANIEDPATATAVWNRSFDEDGDPSNGLSTSNDDVSGRGPLVVKLGGVVEPATVRLVSNQGNLTGSQVLSASSCPTDCDASFANLGVPTLANGLVHTIGVEFSDRAGNAAVPEPQRGDASDESIHAVVDVTPPAGVSAAVCIGESTTPTATTNPASDPATFEVAECATACSTSDSCSRRGGMATLVFDAPADDGSTGDAVTGIEVRIAALGREYDDGGSPTSYDTCDDVPVSGPFEQAFSEPAVGSPGDEQVISVAGLELQSVYCVFVAGVDDLGNVGPTQNFATERVVPWLTDVPGQNPTADIVSLDPLDPDFHDADIYVFEDPDGSNLGYRIENIGDMDGDDRDDLISVRLPPSSGGPGRLFLFFSRDGDLTTPSVTIDAPAIDANPFFGYVMRGGDFDGDGLNDLVVSSLIQTTSGGANTGVGGGALFLWYGVQDTGIRRDVNASDDVLPSIFPDVAILGRAGRYIGAGLAFANLDHAAGDEIAFTDAEFGVEANVYGITGGTRSRFPGSPPATAKVFFDHTALSGGADLSRADWILASKPENIGGVYVELETGDFNGDGVEDLAVFDTRAAHSDSLGAGAGEVYIYEGGSVSGLYQPTVDVGGVVELGGPLVNVLRYDGTVPQFGRGYGVFEDPTGTGGPDWLLVAASSRRRVIVFEGTAEGITDSTPPGGAASYTELSPPVQSGVNNGNFGRSICHGRDPGTGLGEVFIGVGISTTQQNDLVPFIHYTFDADSGALQKGSILTGTRVLGMDCADLGTYRDQTTSTYLTAFGANGALSVLR